MSTELVGPAADTTGAGDDAPAAEVDADGAARDRSRWVAVAVLLVAVAPIVVATVRSIGHDWAPIGDNAWFELRARDVFTRDHPLLGTWTSASVTVGTNLNNPGPLYFDLLALPAKLAPGGPGVAVGAALVNALALVGIVVFAFRRGGALLAALAAATGAALVWSMGSELLYEPWQPHSLLLLFLFFLVLVWSIASDELVAWPWAVAAASVVVQTHLSYAILIAALGAWAVVAQVLIERRRRRHDPDGWPARGRRLARIGAVTLVVAALCWSQPLVEQFTSDGRGNLSRLAGEAAGGDEKLGVTLGIGVVAKVVALPPWWSRAAFDKAFVPDDPGRPVVGGRPAMGDFRWLGTSLASLALVAALLAACAWLAHRRRDRTGVAAVATAAVAVGASLATAVSLPVGVFGVPPHQLRWLWPVSLFVVFSLGVVLVRGISSARRPVAVALAGAAAAVFAVLTFPTHTPHHGPQSDAWAIPVVRDVWDGMGVLEGEGPLLVDLSRARFAEPYSTPVMAELQRRGIPFVVEERGLARQVGETRAYDEGEARAKLFVLEGVALENPPDGARSVAGARGLTDDEVREVARLRREVVASIDRDGVELTEVGRVALEEGRLPVLAGAGGTVSPGAGGGAVSLGEALVSFREILPMVQNGLIELDDDIRPLFEDYVLLQRRSDLEKVALFLAPLDD